MRKTLQKIRQHLYAGMPILYPSIVVVLISSYFFGSTAFFIFELILCAGAVAFVHFYPEEMAS